MLISHVQELLINDRESNGFSPRTIERYEVHIDKFIDFIGDIEITQVHQSHIDEYKLYLLTKIRHEENPYGKTGGKLSRSTINSYVKEIYTMINFARKKKILIDDGLELKYVKEEKKVLEILSEDDIFSLVNLPSGNYIALRNKYMIYLMLDSGLRVQEVEHANIDSIDLNYQCIKVKNTKGMKSRNVPISDTTVALHHKYMQFRPITLSDSLFLTIHQERITYSAIKKVLQVIKGDLGFSKFNAHHLRHTFATRFLIEQLQETQQADIYTLMQILGHEDIDTTMRYLHTAKMYLYQGHKFSPMDRIKERYSTSSEGVGPKKASIIQLYKNNKTP
jgi:site-specific recombinase XerD